jgi:hypothetical protein
MSQKFVGLNERLPAKAGAAGRCYVSQPRA